MPRKDFGTMLEMADDMQPWVPVANVIDWLLPCPSIFDDKEAVKGKYGFNAVRPLSEKTLKRIARGIGKFVLENPSPFIIDMKYNNKPASIKDPLSTITSVNSKLLAMPSLIQYHSEQSKDGVRGQSLDQPIMTLDTSNRYALVSAFMHKYYDGGYKGAGSDARDPLHTVTTHDHNSLCAAYITKLKGENIGQPADKPLQTVTAGGNHFGEVRAFLLKYYGTEGYSEITNPMPTQTTKDRFGLVTIHGVDYAIVDIGLRMLTPRELFNAQGFPEDYVIDVGADGKPLTKAQQTEKCGNAVCPPLAEALVRANVPEMCERSAA
jgi:DNA (cytosine-5)-methyltransferase 1